MNMEKLYKRTYWKNAPDNTTPLNKENLDNIEAGIDGLDDRVIELKSDLGALTDVFYENVLVESGFTLDWYTNNEIGLVPVLSTNETRASYIISAITPNEVYALNRCNDNIRAAITFMDENYVVISKTGWIDGKEYVFETLPNARYFLITFKYSDERVITSLGDFKSTTLKNRTGIDGDYMKQHKDVVWFTEAPNVLGDLNDAQINTKYTLIITSDNVANLPTNYPLTGSNAFLETTKVFYENGRYYIIDQILTMPSKNKVWMREYNSYNAEWGTWKDYSSTEKVFHIGAGYEYTTLRDGIAEAVKYENSTVYVHEGTYDLAVEFADEIASKLTTTYGILLKNNIKVIFLAGSYVTAKVALDDSVRTNFNPFYVDGSFELNGLNIDVSNVRYCVHDEGMGWMKVKTVYRNCVMKNHSDIYVDGTGKQRCYYQCIGGGMGENHFVDIDNCYFDSAMGTDTDKTAVSYHNGGSEKCDGVVFVKNSYFANNNRLGVSWYGSSTKVSKLYANNNSFGKGISCVAETADSTIHNFEVIEWLNEVRN